MEIRVTPTKLEGVVLIDTDFFRDERGFFLENYHRRRFAEHGLDYEFVQDNHSGSAKSVLRAFTYKAETLRRASWCGGRAGPSLEWGCHFRSGGLTLGHRSGV